MVYMEEEVGRFEIEHDDGSMR